MGTIEKKIQTAVLTSAIRGKGSHDHIRSKYIYCLYMCSIDIDSKNI